MFWLGRHPAHLPFPPITPAPSYHKKLCAHICTCQPICASSDPLPLAPSGAAGRGPCWCNLFLEGWPWGRSSNSPGMKFQDPGWGGRGDDAWPLGVHIPFAWLTSPPRRGHSWRRTRWGLCGHSSCNWTNPSQKAMNKWPKRFLGEKMIRIMQAEKEGKAHIPSTPAVWSAHTYSGPSG